MIRDLVKDIVRYFPTKIVPAIVGFISVPVLTRLFLPDDYGNYALVLTTVNIFSILNAWLSMAVIRFLPLYQEEGKQEEFIATTVQTSLISVLTVSFLFLGMAYIFRFRVDVGLMTMLYIGIGMFAVSSFTNILQHFLRAERKVYRYSIFAVWYSVMNLVFGLFFIKVCQVGIQGMLYGFLLSFALAMPFLWLSSVGKPRILPISIDGTMVRAMGKYSFPLVLSNLAGWILGLSDRYIIKLLRGSDEVGIYSASYNISQRTIALFISLFIMALSPIIIHSWEKEGREAVRGHLTGVTRVFLIICIPAVIGLSVLAKPLIGLLLPETYQLGYRIIPFVVAGGFFLGAQQIYQSSFILHKKTLPVLVYFVIAAGINIILNFIFIPKYGYLAAAVTTLLSYLLLFILILYGGRKYLSWTFPGKTFFRVLLAAIIMGVISYYFGHKFTDSAITNLVLGVLSGGIIYFAVLYVLGEFSFRELRQVFASKATD